MSTSEIPWVHWRDIMSTSGGYYEFIRGISWVHQGDIMMLVGEITSTSSDVQYIRGYHEYIGVFSMNWKAFSILLLHMNHDIPQCTEYLLMYSWYPLMYSRYSPNVLIVSLRCTEQTPMYSWYPPMHSWYPPMYWTHIFQGGHKRAVQIKWIRTSKSLQQKWTEIIGCTVSHVKFCRSW